jgi:hypothetical protein
MAAVENSTQIRFYGCPPFVNCEVANTAKDTNPRIIYKDVDPSKLSFDKTYELSNLVATSQIDRFANHVTSYSRRHLRNCGCNGLFRTSTDGNGRAGLPERFSNSSPDSATATGDNGVSPFQ